MPIGTKAALTTDEQDWIIRGMAWVGLRRWLGGAVAGDLARARFQEQLDLRFMRRGSHFTPEMERLEAQLCGPFAEVLPPPVPDALDPWPRSASCRG